MFRQWEPTTCWETWSATLIWSAALCSSVSYLRRTALSAWRNPNTVLSPFSRGSCGVDTVIWPPPPNTFPSSSQPKHSIPAPKMFTQPQQSGLIRGETHDTSVSRFLISWKAKSPPSSPVCACVCMHLCVMKHSWNRVKHVVSFECMIKGVFAHLPHTNKWVKFVCAPHQNHYAPVYMP